MKRINMTWQLVIICIASVSADLYFPDQVHIALDFQETGMRVTWASDHPSYGASVQYTPVTNPNQQVTNFAYSSVGTWVTFPNLSNPKILVRHLSTCTAVMSGLIPGNYYKYRVGSELYGWSQHFAFKARKNFTETPEARLLVYGDFGVGVETAATMARLIQETEDYDYDAIIHDGDFAYDFPDNQGELGDDFMRQIEPIASKIPYMVAQGNHENDNYSPHYYYRFSMPSTSKNLWYSYNLGKAHFLAYSSEFMFESYPQLLPEQQAFIENDLSTYNRTQYPWLIVYSHRPLYCSANWSTTYQLNSAPYIKRHNNDCLQDAETVRNAFEDLWYNYKVDFVINAHVHAYERLAPVYKNQSVPCEYQDQNTCIGAKAPAYVVTGTPGNQESYAPISPTPLPFSMAQDSQWGFSRLTVINETHMYWEQVRSVTKEVSDWFWLIKGKN